VQVCRQLDGLSHFHFTPRPVVLESRVFGAGPENALPSLSLEDVIPTTENSGGLLAPEEVPAFHAAYSHEVVCNFLNDYSIAVTQSNDVPHLPFHHAMPHYRSRIAREGEQQPWWQTRNSAGTTRGGCGEHPSPLGRYNLSLSYQLNCFVVLCD
jgi:Mpp10 protein